MRVKPRKRSNFTNDERQRILAAGTNSTVRMVCKEYGISLSTFYRWRASVDAHKSEEGVRLNHLESENRRLKRQVAELWLDYTSLRNALINGKGREC
ncbi:Transposase, IS3/IS911 family [Nitrospira defluvii]|jgi:transposase-like protein|uniref:Transposase, IS3/IS911 family n=1 Tax=Nitrospira defluvii TaxID=330214 RepID=D8PGN2_9BACT|nr:Transposase, IS3/IS911 family [Nitrospira defluvii]